MNKIIRFLIAVVMTAVTAQMSLDAAPKRVKLAVVPVVVPVKKPTVDELFARLKVRVKSYVQRGLTVPTFLMSAYAACAHLNRVTFCNPAWFNHFGLGISDEKYCYSWRPVVTTAVLLAFTTVAATAWYLGDLRSMCHSIAESRPVTGTCNVVKSGLTYILRKCNVVE